jgi:hypothetical protein
MSAATLGECGRQQCVLRPGTSCWNGNNEHGYDGDGSAIAD